MEKKYSLVLIGISLFTLLSLPVKAQHNRVEVKGIIIEKDSEEPIEAATVRLLSELAKGMDSLRKEGGLSIEEAFAGLEE